MKATIDIPDELYRRVKARSAQEGRRIREVTAELFLQWLDASSPRNEKEATIPLVKPDQLRRCRDARSLQQAYPQGYRLTGPLLPAANRAPIILATAVDQALEKMDMEELKAHARAR